MFVLLGKLYSFCFFKLEYNCFKGFPGGGSSKEHACQCRRRKRHGFNPWVGKIPWRRAWQPIPVFLPGEPPWTEKPGRLQSMGSQCRTQLSDKHFLSHLRHLLSDLSYCPVTKSCRFVHHVHVLLETEGSYELRTSAFSKLVYFWFGA